MLFRYLWLQTSWPRLALGEHGLLFSMLGGSSAPRGSHGSVSAGATRAADFPGSWDGPRRPGSFPRTWASAGGQNRGAWHAASRHLVASHVHHMLAGSGGGKELQGLPGPRTGSQAASPLLRSVGQRAEDEPGFTRRGDRLPSDGSSRCADGHGDGRGCWGAFVQALCCTLLLRVPAQPLSVGTGCCLGVRLLARHTGCSACSFLWPFALHTRLTMRLTVVIPSKHMLPNGYVHNIFIKEIRRPDSSRGHDGML